MIAIIPARGGSKGLPGKNTRDLLGKPMIAYTIEEALKSEYITDVIISTDCKNIYEVALLYGAKETFLRPSELADDNSLAIDNYIYTVNKLNNEYAFNIKDFVVLQPTSPLRIVEDIDASIKIFKDKKADSVISYTEENHPLLWHKYINTDGTFESIFEDNNLKNRQENKKSFYPNGAVMVFNFNVIKEKKYYSDKSYSYIMPYQRSVDIDTLDDFKYAEFLMKEKLNNEK